MHNLWWLKLGCSHCISAYSAFACLGLAAWQLQLQLTRLPASPGNVMVITCRAVLYPTACSSLSCLKRLHLDLLSLHYHLSDALDENILSLETVTMRLRALERGATLPGLITDAHVVLSTQEEVGGWVGWWCDGGGGWVGEVGGWVGEGRCWIYGQIQRQGLLNG